MMFSWNDQTCRWLEDASEWTGYNKSLARLLLEHIPRRDSLCDIGCGLGLVDLELARDIRAVTCVDIADYAVEYLRRRAAESGADNITVKKSDGMALSGRWDTVLALFHGSVDLVCRKYLSMADDRLLFVTHSSQYSVTGPESYRVRKSSNVPGDSQWLDTSGVVYTLHNAALAFGQPHRSFEDAVTYHRTFSNGAPEDELREYVKGCVQETGRDDFPFFTQKVRRFGIFVIRREDNEDYLARNA